MSLSDAERAMQKIECLCAEFDRTKATHYVALVKEFLSKSRRYCDAHGLPRVTPSLTLRNDSESACRSAGTPAPRLGDADKQYESVSSASLPELRRFLTGAKTSHPTSGREQTCTRR